MNHTIVTSADGHFGPFFHVRGRQDFDFTLLFEDAILSILPSALFLLVAPARIWSLWKERRKVATSQLRDIKLAVLSAYIVAQIINLVVWLLHTEFQTSASIAAACLTLAAAVVMFLLSYLEHSRSVRPSSIINVYLFFTVFFDAAKVRTLWIRGDSNSIAGVSTTVLFVKLALLITEAKEKRKYLLSPHFNISPEATSGLYSRSLFWWLNPMFLLGYRNIIRDADVFPTDDDLMSENLHQKVQSYWTKRHSFARKYELIWSLTRCMLRPLAAGVAPRLFLTFFRYMQPLLIKSVTTWVAQPDTSLNTKKGWGLTAAYGIVFFGIAISAAQFNHRAFRLATMVRGALVTTIYKKTMDLSITALNESAAVTLMSTDVQRICDALPVLHELWACPIEIALAIWLLYNEIGLALLGPLTVTLAAIGAAFAISSRTGPAQKQWLSSIQTRVDVTSKALQSIKGVKMLGLISKIHDIIKRLRTEEIKQSLKTRRLFAFNLLSANSTDVFAPAAALTIFVIIARYNGQTLDVGLVYTALSLIYLLASPIGVLSFALPKMMAAVGCFDRIQEYLLSTSRHDHRLPLSQRPNQDQAAIPQAKEMKSGATGNAIELREMGLFGNTSSRVPLTNCAVLRAVNLSLSWNQSSEKLVISDVSFELGPGVTMLVGPIASGKSSLLKGLLGEIPSSKGYVYTDSLQMAFVGQDPWIQDGTLRQNIIGVSDFKPEFYSHVIHACALDQDFDAFAQGDLTLVGSAGTGLSGGQKLRVALARAVYSKKTILILDDVLSGLDATSEDRIFTRLLGKQGFLRGNNTAVLLATHAAHRLSYADKVIALDVDGSIREQGSFEDLAKSTGYISSLAARHTTEDEGKPKEIAELVKIAGLSTSAQANAVDDLTRATGDVKVYKYYFSAIGYAKSTLAFILIAGFGFFLLFPDLWVKFWTSAVAKSGNSVNGKYLAGYLALKAMSLLCLAWMSFHVYTVLIPTSARKLHMRLLDTTRKAPLSFFTSTDIGQTINRFSQDMNVIDYELPSAFFECTASVCIGVMQAILICISAAYFAVIVPGVLGLMYIIQKFYLRTSRQIRLMDLEAKAPLYSNFIESLNGLTTIRAFGWSNDFEQRNMVLLDNSQRPFYMLFCIQRWLNLVLDLTVAGLAVVLMILIVTLRSKLDPGFVGLALLNIMSFNLSLTQVIKCWTELETSIGAVSRVMNFVQGTTSEHLSGEIYSVPDDWPSQGSIKFRGVSASYTIPGSLILKDIDLFIPAGQKIGLVGRSGSGKSSFITTLFHMLEIVHGTITIDELDLSTIPREELRQRLNVIPQDPVFLAGNIRLNIDPFSIAKSDEQLVSALETVNLWSTISTAGGLDVQMDSENLLSHGQRQLFCLARAIVNKSQSSILVLDEATASVDIQTDEMMQKVIRAEFQKCTIIAVAHRLGTIVDFDRVIVLDSGRIVEDGSPERLLEDGNSQFRKLWDS